MGLIGYGIVTNGHYHTVIDTLNNSGCQRIFTDDCDTQGNPGKGFYDAVDYLTPHDILVIDNIAHLGKSIDSVFKNLAILSNKKANLHILDNNLTFSLKESENNSLLQILINFHLQATHFKTQTRTKTMSQKGITAGRKTLIDDNTRKKIETLIAENYSVKDICLSTKIKESTFYKHFSLKHGYKQAVGS